MSTRFIAIILLLFAPITFSFRSISITPANRNSYQDILIKNRLNVKSKIDVNDLDTDTVVTIPFWDNSINSLLKTPATITSKLVTDQKSFAIESVKETGDGNGNNDKLIARVILITVSG